MSRPNTRSELSSDNHLLAFGKKIIHVETSSFQTVNLHTNRDTVLYSGILTACCVLVIKDWNAESQKYNGVITMAHIYPTNTHSLVDKDWATKNLQKIIADFQKKGGKLNEKTSIQLFAGLAREAAPDLYAMGRPTEREVIDSAIKKLQLHETCKYKEHKGSALKDIDKGQVVFVDRYGTQIIREKGAEFELITPVSESSLKLQALTDITLDIFCSHSNPFLQLELDRSNTVVSNAKTGKGLPIESMEKIHEAKCNKLELIPSSSLAVKRVIKLNPNQEKRINKII